MSSLKTEYLENLTFTAEQISTLRSLGEYRGKQALFFKQSPEALKSLQLVAKIEYISSRAPFSLEEIDISRLGEKALSYDEVRNYLINNFSMFGINEKHDIAVKKIKT